MKLNQINVESIHHYRRMIMSGTLASVALLTVACFDKPAEKVQAAQPAQAASVSATPMVKTANASLTKAMETKSIETAAVRQPGSKTLRYRSRDYAVSFEYPWQYSLANAKKISEDAALRPRSDGHEGQITLARIDLPKGFYPDTNFESGYFTLSLNPALKEQDCKTAIDLERQSEAQTAISTTLSSFGLNRRPAAKAPVPK